jgi:hypothetical protein
MATAERSILEGIPDELIDAVAREASLDADRVLQFLEHPDMASIRSEARKSMPRWFLLGLGAALRLLAWEANGSRARLAVELPPARQAIRDIFLAAAESPLRLESIADELTMIVFRAWVNNFAWLGRSTWDADLVLGESEEDDLVEILADFLWVNRGTPAVWTGGAK